MPLPAADLTKTNLDSTADDPELGVVEIAAIVDKVNALLSEALLIKDEASDITVTLDIIAQTTQLILKAATSAGAYVQFNSDNASPATLKGRIGFSDATDMRIENQVTGGDVNIITTGAGEAQVNGDLVYTEGNLTKVYDIEFFHSDEVPASALIGAHRFSRAVDHPINLTSSQAYANTAPSGGAVDFDLQKNGLSVGTVSFADGANSGTFTFSSATSYAAGDRFTMHSGASVFDIADVFITFAGTHTA